MGRLVGYMANRTDRFRAALHQERAVLGSRGQSTGPAGWGVGFHQGGEVLHKKRPQLDASIPWVQLASDVQSDSIVCHLRTPTVGDLHSYNTHPFRFRSWLFAHTGTIERFGHVRARLLEAIPDFLRRNIRGKTDSEHLFHLVISFLHDAGQVDNPDVPTHQVVAAVRSAVALVDRLTAEVRGERSTVNLVLANGRQMIGVCRGGPMMFVERRGLHDPPEETLPARAGAPSVLRYVMIVSDSARVPSSDAPEADSPEADSSGTDSSGIGSSRKEAEDYRRVDDGSVVAIDRQLQVTIAPL